MDLTRSNAREHLEHAVEAINRTHARSFRLLHRFGAGSFGAWKVTDAAGERRVLKWFDGEFRLAAWESAAHTTARLRALGCARSGSWPTSPARCRPVRELHSG